MITIKYNQSSTDLINKAEALLYNDEKQLVFSKNFEGGILRNKMTSFDNYKINFFKGKNRLSLQYSFLENKASEKEYEHSTLMVNKQKIFVDKNKKSKFSKALLNFFSSLDTFLFLSSKKDPLYEEDIREIQKLSLKLDYQLQKIRNIVNKELYYQGYDEKELIFIAKRFDEVYDFVSEIKEQYLNENVVEIE